ncbi:MAG: beta-lactamase family protein [Acidobacteria bacterium]|nr:beta-lactamase family protein [Acidobacteriota bacterium]
MTGVAAGRFRAIEALLVDAVGNNVCPAAAAEVGTSSGPVWQGAAGWLDDTAQRPASVDSGFDLASLTKVIVTTTLAMRQVDAGCVTLETRIGDRLSTWEGGDRAHVTVGDLLAHASGLSAYLPFYRDHVGRREFEAAICRLPLEYVPRSRSIYSDLGFILLGFVLEDLAGSRLDEQFAGVCVALGFGGLLFRPAAADRERIAPTGVDPWRGRCLRGEVHDGNAWALGGAAGHAGLFGSARAVGTFARRVLADARGATPRGERLASAAVLERFLRRTDVPGSSRALGWDTMLPTSSCGPKMHVTAIGHTGFTGTSLWIDIEADAYFVLLTNRVHPDPANEAILTLRPTFHSMAIDALATRSPQGV